ncbi:MAG TPA: hypothetical protein ENK83_00170 [Aliiroseovarius sp.]|nr:hypothetical protein [Aliiroseovarius sp.]
MSAATFTIPTIETERLWLRAIKESDFEPEAEFFASDRTAHLGGKTAISMILHGNTRSVALAERLGARLERDFEHERFGPCHICRHPSPEALRHG